MREKSRRPSPLQRRVLIVLAALGAKRPGPVATRDIERVLEQGGDAPVYRPNLRASCRRMEAAGWLRTLRAPNLQLAVELTDAGRALAAPLLADEQARVLAEQRAAAVRVLPLVRMKAVYESDSFGDERPVALDDRWHLAVRGDYVILRRHHLPAAVECGRAVDTPGRRSCRSPPGCRPVTMRGLRSGCRSMRAPRRRRAL